MGVDPAECQTVGELLGLKTFVNEFVAYAELKKITTANPLILSVSRESGTEYESYRKLVLTAISVLFLWTGLPL